MTESELYLLAIDVGSHTQDILLYDSRREIENCVKLVLPSQTSIVAQRIRQATRSGHPVFLDGNLMGGGPCVGAMMDHLAAGYEIYATELAAKTIRDNLQEVEAMGIRLGPPPASVQVLRVRLGDVDLEALRWSLAPFLVELPSRYAIALQDHGECLTGSNREFRFRAWEEFLAQGGNLDGLLYPQAPSPFTRMQAVQRDLPGAWVMDTGAAAVQGALCDPWVAERAQEGVVVVNVGNQHTLAILLQGERIEGLFEHHTSCLNRAKLQDYVERLREGRLMAGEILQDGGHGNLCAPASLSFRSVAVTGPKRKMAEGLGYYFAVPHGDMMLTGCFGLVRSTLRLCARFSPS
ncbi:MAG: DUF1786 domain-containing protein [Candidatus Tectomicrobia bacterium]|uniref:DUF1786 domain-containing protein n=1 Tax=Tectimicrobiota bacterium TaxID=2528274 RepID=A0A932CP95_UNCTE|nr:DUF1786 domain-containing protein [Candidatus Tectomicrobia bacterium]